MSDEAWFAGLFEGEGTITITRSGRRGYTRPLVQLMMTDFDVVEMFAARWPGGVLWTMQPKGNARLALGWRLQSRPGIRHFLADLGPEFRTERVRIKAALLLEDIDARVQGIKDPAYLVACNERREKMRALNKRGAA